MNRSTLRILLGLGLGLVTGLVLGERAAILKFVADAYLRLLQMTVLPYVMVSVIAGFGSLNALQARRLFVRVGTLTLAVWALALGTVFLMPLMFPKVETANFYSSSLVEQRPPFDLLSLYIPTNAFSSLANNVVPAVVLFSAFLGIALIGIEKKEPLLSALQVLEKVLSRANRFAVQLTPFGLFAIAAHTVGTVDTTEIGHLRVFLICYGAMSLLLALWILPGLVACLTPIPVHRILHSTRDALITAFMTGELFVVLPTLIERAKALLEEHGFPEPEDGSPPDVIIPSFYNFPHAAKLLSLSFVLFAAWYSDTVLTHANLAQLGLAGVLSMFGGINAAIPFLLDFARVPADSFQLFLATGVVNSRFGTLAAAMHMLVLALAGTYALTGTLRFSTARILRYALTTATITGITVAAVGFLLRVTGPGTYDKDKLAMEMGFRLPSTQKAVLLKELPKTELALPEKGLSVLDAVRKRECLRVGYVDSSMPYSFLNQKGELTGFDVEMAHVLAAELGVAIEFAPVPREQLPELLDAGVPDVIMSGVFETTRRASQTVFSSPYLDETLAFIVPDHRRADFSSADWIRGKRGLRVAVPNLNYLLTLVRREFPNVTIVEISMSQLNDFFLGRGEPVDALVLTAERGSFQTLLHPAFSVAVPQPVNVKIPLAYPVARQDTELARFLDLWIDLKKKDGTIQKLYDYWVLGKNVQQLKPRWSVLRNVLHWVE